MTQFPKPLDIQTLHKTLPKKLSHIKEEAKIKFIHEALRLYRLDKNFGLIDFSKSTYNGTNINLVYSQTDKKISIEELVHSIMEKWYFSNLEKNENVYFYRFINVFRAKVSVAEYNRIDKFLKNSENLSLRENYKQYTDYRKKLDEIDDIISSTILNVKEN